MSETKTVSVCHLEGALWQTEGVALLNDYPDSFFQLILRIDPDDHPNLVFGGGGFYGDWGSRPFNYWRHDGTQWLQELNDISLDSALSFTLAPSGSPHILFSEDRQLSYLAKPGTSWVREEITTALRMIAIWMGPDNGPHVVCKTNEGLSYYARTATQWIKGPVIAPPPAEDYEYALVAGCCDSVNRPFVCYAIFDPVGMIVPPLDTTLMYATLDGEWLAEEVYRGDLRLTSGATLALDSSGQPHLVLELIPWHGGESIYDSVYHIWRE